MHLKPKARKQQILDAAVSVAQKHGFDKMTRVLIATKADCSVGLVSLRFGTMQDLEKEVMRHAVKTECLDILATGVALGHPVAMRAPADLRNKAVNTLAK